MRPRIRSIKPEFWTDGKIRRLPDSTALFYIALWNHCDDFGYFETDSLQLASRISRWRPQEVIRFLRVLHERGMIMSSASHGVGMVVSWSHQKVDKRLPSKWKDQEIQWDDAPYIRDFTPKDRIGKDRIGYIGEASEKSATKKKKVTAIASDTPTVASDTSKEVLISQQKEEAKEKARAFVAAYVKAYQVKFPAGRPEDLSDGKVRGQILNWIKDYSLERAKQLIQVFFQMDNKWFQQKGYDFMTFRNNLNLIGQALDSGVDPSGSKIDWEYVFGRKEL